MRLTVCGPVFLRLGFADVVWSVGGMGWKESQDWTKMRRKVRRVERRWKPSQAPMLERGAEGK